MAALKYSLFLGIFLLFSQEACPMPIYMPKNAFRTMFLIGVATGIVGAIAGDKFITLLKNTK